MSRFLHLCGLIGLALLALAAPAAADDADDIRLRYDQWTEDFNNGRDEVVCDLFSPALIANFRGQPERRFTEICGLLKDSLADPARDFFYQFDVHEIIVEGDLAVVRLTRSLFITPLNITSIEPSMDVLRREGDGAWRIIRFLAYEAP